MVGAKDPEAGCRTTSKSARAKLSTIALIAGLPLLWSCSHHSQPVAPSPDVLPLHEAVRQGDLEATTRLLGAGAYASSPSGSYSTPLLTVAVHLGDEDMVAVLVAHGANVDALDTFGNTPLFWAVGVPSAPPEIADILLSAGADPNVRNRMGATPLWNAALMGRVEVIRLLILYGAEINVRSDFAPLDSATTLGRIEAMEVLLDAGAQVDIQSPSGSTPLHSAALGERSSAAALLLTRGADVDAVTESDLTPLHFAAGACGEEDERLGETETAELLIAHGAQINAVGCDGMTPLDVAAQVEDEAMVALLLRHGARSGHELLTPTASPTELGLGDHRCR